MHNNIGGKIKALAKVITWVGIIGSVISGGLQIASGANYRSSGAFIITGLLTIVGGSLIAWISSFILYGFGQLIENSDRIANRPPH